MRKTLAALAAVVALATQPARAEGVLVKCLAGCPTPASKALKLDQQLADTWFLGPSVGLSIAARGAGSKQWDTGVAFQFLYGVHWKPTWSPMPTFMSFNLGLSAGSISAFTSGGTFDITIAPTITILDLIAVGYGPRFKLATSSGQHDAVQGVLFIGLATSFGGP